MSPFVAMMPDSLLRTPMANADIELGSGPVVADVGAEKVVGVATAILRWLPSPRVEIIAEFENGSPFWIAEGQTPDEPDLLCSFTDWGITAPLRVRAKSLGSGATITGHLRDFGLAESVPHCDYVAFHLANVPAVFAGAVSPEGIRHVRPNLVLKSESWVVEVDPVGDIFRLEKSLEESGGYAITHHCTLRRSDGTPFSRQAASDVLEWLGSFFSFGFGHRVAPLLARGYLNDSRVWEERQLRVIDQFDTWLDIRSAESLETAFPGFALLAQSAIWERPLRSAVYWFINANVAAGGVDTAIVLAQAALELLAWTRLVQETKSVSPDGFEKLPAADEIRLVLSACEIPLAIPRELTDLVKLAKAYNWVDGPAAVTSLRNSIVHPNLEKRFKFAEALVDVWRLSQWYVELVVLRQTGFRGMYSSRLTARWVGQVEPVPWANVPAIPTRD